MTGYFFQSNVVSDMNVHWVNSGLFILDGHNYLHLMTIKGFNTSSHRCSECRGAQSMQVEGEQKTKNPAHCHPSYKNLMMRRKKKRQTAEGIFEPLF